MRLPTLCSGSMLALAMIAGMLATAQPTRGQSNEGEDARLERFVPKPAQLRRADRTRGQLTARAYKLRLNPQWSGDGDALWYRNDLRDDRREFILVDAAHGTREPAFDHDRLAAALRQHGVEDVDGDRLPIERLWVDAAKRLIEFRAGNKWWRCSLDVYELTEIESTERSGAAAGADEGVAAWTPQDGPRASTRTGQETTLTFLNRTDGEIELFWLDASGNRVSYGKIPASGQRDMHTYAGHVWSVEDAAGDALVVFEADEMPGEAEVTGEPPARRRGGRGPGQRRGRNRGANRDDSGRSPDGKWTAFIRDNNVFLRELTNEEDDADDSDESDSAKATQLTTDGREGNAYDSVLWAPDSVTFLASRTEPGDNFEVYLLESSPRGGGRARLRRRPYPLPGDKFPITELNVFNVATHKQIKPKVDRVDFEASRPHWLRNGEAFVYEQIDRGHQRYRLIEVQCRTGDVRTLIDERTDAFIWTTHYDGDMPRIVTWIDGDEELIYASERDGWRHLYLFDAKAGVVKNQITRGDWVVRSIGRIDDENRQIWFAASGMNADQDPYFLHHYRINFDGTGLTALTEGDGNHRIEFSPNRRFLIDSYSRVDMPTVHELRRADDGKLVVELERGDASELEADDWNPPEVFTAKGRDGKTDILGVICRPLDFDPAKRYPVIEYIYAGPQGSFVPKSFNPSRQFAHLNALGFIVVQIDGMGTANRSKAFHDVCWHNLADAGFPDRILWHKAVAAKYPQYDLDRLGIYGGSAGGQNAAGAVLFHGDFYKAAVAGCGCHDNRMDKASWNEQWMGYPVGPHYAKCSNIENAAKLTGNLMLIVGELDDNVPVESTYRFADALIKAEKDFDLVVVPGAGHGMGGAYGERRMRDFFVKHLFGVDPPNRNAP